jgi:hypothetical protein
VVGEWSEIEIKTKSAQLKLELGPSLRIQDNNRLFRKS